MHLEIDVSGHDIFSENYAICLSAGDGRVKGFKFDGELIRELKKNWKNGKYDKYPYQQQNQGAFKTRIYCVIGKLLLGELFNGFNDKVVGVHFCGDFPGHEDTIKASLNHCITHIHKKQTSKVHCARLPSGSDAHRYAKMMHQDIYRHLGIYVNISLGQIEPYLMWMEKKKE